MISMGVDVGTRFVKVCIAKDNRMAGFAMAPAGNSMKSLIEGLAAEAASQAKVSTRKISRIAATGMGAALVKSACGQISETHCAALAIGAFHPEARTVVDAGGLFISIGLMDEKGALVRTLTNDPCAAGSGKFLEMVAQALEMPLEELAHMGFDENQALAVESNCAVFAESEVISQVNAGADPKSVWGGVLHSVAARTATLVERINAVDPVYAVGGVSAIAGYRARLEAISGRKLVLPDFAPQAAAAFGAAIYAAGLPAKGLLGRIFN
ncbi:MAG: acyl-CoA dehydratase activase [Desulfatibacillaceae bacterium]|nr:acyl-CoA dehydratase activase [Desulfatibacillaceae bacterium]